MDKPEAKIILAEQLARFRLNSYAELVKIVGEVETYEVTGTSGASYQLEFQVFWDDKKGGDLRVAGAIDDGGWRALCPLTDDFIVGPDGKFVGE